MKMKEPKWYDFKKLTKEEALKLTTTDERYNFFLEKLSVDLKDKELDYILNLVTKARNKVEKYIGTDLEKVYLVKVSILFKIAKRKDYSINKERYDEHTNHMLNQLPKDLNMAKEFHKQNAKKKSKSNPEQARWHAFMTRALTEQGY